ncbi:MAG: SusD/RagB family nutrient-binding outer membrane lipoprotein [Tannerellaceae bacterium]|jgi:hypothetical protein|nr:SusD/RagB family nutrient-binding outer membrane lipoprotein [Tannerellaceae bacterium]
MKRKNILFTGFFVSLLLASCIDLTETNENPTEITQVGGYLHLSTILSSTANLYHVENFSSAEIITAMQYIQILNKVNECNYIWNQKDWTGYYDILRNNKAMYNSAEEQGNHFYKGVALVIKSFLFGYITDLWGDCPYTDALKGDEGIYSPPFDTQETVFNGIFADLEQANEELSAQAENLSSSEGAYDLAYGGDGVKWRKMANSLALRYYMRLSAKQPDKARAGIEKIMGNPAQYPVFGSNDDICQIAYPGQNSSDSWIGGPLRWTDNGNSFRNRKPCRTFINTLSALDDPRLPVWFTPVEVQIVVEEPPYTYPEEDITVGNKRYVHDNAEILAGGSIEYDEGLYVGLPHNVINRFYYNLTSMNEDARNVSVSYLTPRYNQNTDELVKATLISYAEVCFILAEAAQRGWSVGASAETYYNDGVKASLEQYRVGEGFDRYIRQDGAKYDGTLARIIEQKWIAQYLLPESWFDFRRTGLPELPVNYPEAGKYPAIPVRFIYPTIETRNNTANYTEAIGRLEKTPYSDLGNDDHYSKPWILQGTNKPW